MRKAAYEELPERFEGDDEGDGEDPWEAEGIHSVDWKESPFDVLDLVGDQLAAFDLELVLYDSGSDSYVWKIEALAADAATGARAVADEDPDALTDDDLRDTAKSEAWPPEINAMAEELLQRRALSRAALVHVAELREWLDSPDASLGAELDDLVRLLDLVDPTHAAENSQGEARARVDLSERWAFEFEDLGSHTEVTIRVGQPGSRALAGRIKLRTEEAEELHRSLGPDVLATKVEGFL